MDAVTPKDKTLAGIDIDVSGLTLKTTDLGPDVAKVEITGGRVSYRVTQSELGPKAQQAIQGHLAKNPACGSYSQTATRRPALRSVVRTRYC